MNLFENKTVVGGLMIYSSGAGVAGTFILAATIIGAKVLDQPVPRVPLLAAGTVGATGNMLAVCLLMRLVRLKKNELSGPTPR